MEDEEDGKKSSRKIWEKVQSCEMMPFRKNYTGKEKKKLMWGVNEDSVIRNQIIKILGC